MTQVINPSSFRQYDIRGIAETDLNSEGVKLIAKAYGALMKRDGAKTVSLGRDMRVSSVRIQGAFEAGLLEAGLNVIDVGMVATPMLYFSIAKWKLDGGVMITGSHNPPEYNGLKLCHKDGSVWGEQIQEMKDMILAGEFEVSSGSVEKKSIADEYVDYLKEQFKFARGMKIVCDSGNGMGGLLSPKVFRELGCEVIELFSEPDGTFPNHHPDPSQPKYLTDCIAAVKKEGADLGFAFDGDADRVGVIDEKGEMIFPDQLLILYARKILKDTPGATFIADVKCSKTLYDDIKKHGGNPIMWKTGHAIIKAKIKETGAALAGELSGHMFFNDRYFGFDDALYAACRTLEVLDEAPDKVFSDLLSDVPKMCSTPELHIDTTDEKKFEIIEQASEYFKGKFDDVCDIDGFRINFEDGWGLARASNTQPVLVLRFEAKTEARVKEIQNLIESKINEIISTV
jgi:phosphomannomutase/phosphoglucomutase